MDFCPQVERLMFAVGAKTVKQLAEIIGVKPTAISNWNGRKKIADDAIVTSCLEFGLSVQWLAEGKGPMRWAEHHAAPAVNEGPPPDYQVLKKQMNEAWDVADEDARETALYVLEKSAKRLQEKGEGGSNYVVRKSA